MRERIHRNKKIAFLSLSYTKKFTREFLSHPKSLMKDFEADTYLFCSSTANPLQVRTKVDANPISNKNYIRAA